MEIGGICWITQKVFQNVLGMFQYNSVYLKQAYFLTFHIVPVGFDQNLTSCFTTKLLTGPHAMFSYSYPKLVWHFLVRFSCSSVPSFVHQTPTCCKSLVWTWWMSPVKEGMSFCEMWSLIDASTIGSRVGNFHTVELQILLSERSTKNICNLVVSLINDSKKQYRKV